MPSTIRFVRSNRGGRLFIGKHVVVARNRELDVQFPGQPRRFNRPHVAKGRVDHGDKYIGLVRADGDRQQFVIGRIAREINAAASFHWDERVAHVRPR